MRSSEPSETEEPCTVDYADDIHSHLLSRERARFPYHARGAQTHLRPCMLEFLDQVCSLKTLSPVVLHLAAYLMDVFMDNNVIATEHWRLVAVGCLSVAVKLEENTDLIPRNKDFNKFLSGKYNLKDIVDFEVSLLTFFKWNVKFPTVAHFLEYYELYALSPVVDGLDRPTVTYELFKKCMRRYLEYFQHAVLEDTSFYNYRPSVLAASCIASARIHMMLTPAWHSELKNVTKYKYKELKACTFRLLSLLQKDLFKFETHSRKEGEFEQ